MRSLIRSTRIYVAHRLESNKNLWAIDFVDKYNMKLNFIERFKATIATDPRFAEMRARQTFKSAARVEIITDDMSIVEEANDYVANWSMTKLVRRGAHSISGRRVWEFEDENDAIQFQMKMGGNLIRNYGTYI